MTLSEIAYSIKMKLEGLSPSDDSLLEDEYIYSRINLARAYIIKMLERQNQSIDDDFYQSICCLKVECEELICDGIQLEESFIVKLPHIVSVKKGIKYFGTTNFRNGFQYVNTTGYVYNHASQLASKGTYYTVIGNTAHIRNLPTPDTVYVCIVAILEDPLEGGCIDITADEEYPLPAVYLNDVEQMVVQSMMISMQIFPDMANDASPDARINAMNVYMQMQTGRRRRTRDKDDDE